MLLDLCAVATVQTIRLRIKFVIINEDADWHLKCQAKLGPEIRSGT